jgi:GT2 family glycosyltransferase
MNNVGARTAKGEILALVNNDIEVISGNWLDEMVRHALRSNVGAVGAKLLYPDDTIQHAGIILGIGGIAGHAFKYARKDEPGYFRRASLAQNLSAVTGACMVMRKECYLAVGGMDSDDLKVSFNDIDLCLKLRAAGYDIVWTPHALLRHHESASRGKNNNREKSIHLLHERKTMIERWGPLLRNDPYYNPNLSLKSEDILLGSLPTPRVDRPWLAYRSLKVWSAA